jgi:glycosyltransferase involved in cell wall biosynthesis
MKVSVVISACDNRIAMFGRALDTWASQTMPKSDFELLVVDDAQREDLRALCRERALADGLNILFIRIDKNRSVIPVKSFIPALTNNVGFRCASGEVVVVTGPETIQRAGNLETAWTMRNRMECAYGLVFKANIVATDYIAKGWDRLKRLPIEHVLQIPGAKSECLTRPPHPPAYWYFMAVARRHVEAIGGIDERFLGGLCAEDDDFANRMRAASVRPVFEHRIVGIHQDHSREDHGDGIHIDRRQGAGLSLKAHNQALMRDNLARKVVVANEGHEWGSESLITLRERCGKENAE